MLKKTGVVVAAVAALLMGAAPFAFADSQHNDQECSKSIINELKIPILGDAESEHSNKSSCKQDNGDEQDEHGDDSED